MTQAAPPIVRPSVRLRIAAAALILLTGSVLQAAPVVTAVAIDHPGSATRAPGIAATEPIPEAITIAAGHSHTCAIMSDDTVRCWGQGGALGDGTQKRRLTPIIVTGLSSATALSAGIGHTCALLADHTIRCWGGNNYGQSGDGLPDLSVRLTPVKVAGISSATAISAGENHTCARLSNGTVRCWGYNGYSQLGDGGISNHQTPVTVPGITTAIAVAAGTNHTCVVLQGGTARCWGMNNKGELGDGTTTNRTVPVAVAFISTATAISADGWAGYGRTCAILADSTARCWGISPLGHGFSETSPTPVAVSDITTAIAISAGGSHNCILVADQTVWCWGDDTSGAVGDGSDLSYIWSPVAVANINTATSVTTGREHSCAVLADGTAWCWGSNLAGQIGDDSTTPRFTPVQVNFALKTPFTDIAASDYQVDIEWVYEQGITSGCSPTLYCPVAVVRRGEMASFLARALNLSGPAPDAFTDDETSVHEVNINLVAREGIASGCGGTQFCPTGVVTREQMASFLARALDLGDWAPDAFTDDETSIHEVNINLIAREGITTGCTESGTYCPKANVTRGPMAAFLHRAFLP